ncbi:MAG: P-loop NTPase [Methanomicrobiales archaeon]|nr:P-loop NTPase [Methanomicrobiales archaeon]
MKIAVASGKGGTGKSMVAGNFARVMSRDRTVVLVDADVEEPNLHLFFPAPATAVPVTVPEPAVDPDRCTNCGECGRFCRYGALTVTPSRVLFFRELCHSCGGCALVCPEGAIRETPVVVGSVETRVVSDTLTLISGIMNEGEIRAPPVIAAAKKAAESHPLIILDIAPGVTCPVVEALSGCDACILVTEPTPFGLHDLDLAVRLCRMLAVPAGVVVNRHTPGGDEVFSYCEERGLPVLLTIPFDRTIAAVQNAGGLIADHDPAWQDAFSALAGRITAFAEEAT